MCPNLSEALRAVKWAPASAGLLVALG